MGNEKNINQDNQSLDNLSGEQIVEKYKKIDGLPNGYSDFYSSENIDALITFNKIAENPRGQNMYEYYENIAKMNSLAADITYKDLMNGLNYQNTEMAKYVMQLKPNEILKKYEYAREEYWKYYATLSKEDKEKLDKYDIDHINITKYIPAYALGLGLALSFAGADRIRVVVNSQIVKTYIEQSGGLILKAYAESGNKFDEKFKNNFNYTTKNMDIIELSHFYKEIEKELTDLTFTNPNLNKLDKKEQEKIQQDYQKEVGDIQMLFGSMIFERTNKIPENFESKEKQEEFLSYKEKFIISVCMDYFTDFPYFTTKYNDVKTVNREFAKQRLAGMNALKNAEERYYNLSKVKQILEKMNYQEIKNLSNKSFDEVLTKEEIDKAKGLFRR